jgi:pilus assembly protein CpaE
MLPQPPSHDLIGIQKTIDFLAFATDARTLDTLNSLVNQHWRNGVVIQGGSIAALNANPAMNGMPKNLVVDISDSANPDVDAERIVQLFNGSQSIIFIGQNNDVNFYRTIVRAGGSDYLVKPIAAEDIYASIISNASLKNTPVTNAPQAISIPGRAKIITIIGVHGGVGTSTVTASLGILFAERFGQSTAIVDLDVHFGTIALSFNKEPSIGFRDALESPARIDATFLENALVKIGDKLSILAAEENLDSYISYSTTAINLLLDKLGTGRQTLLLDTPRTLIVRFPHLVSEASTIVVVTDLTIVGLRDCLTLVDKLRSIAPGADIRIVANRVRGKAEGQIDLRDFAKEIGLPVTAIPDAPEIIGRALNEGKFPTVMKSNNRCTSVFETLCRELDAGKPIVKKSFLQKFISK